MYSVGMRRAYSWTVCVCVRTWLTLRTLFSDGRRATFILFILWNLLCSSFCGCAVVSLTYSLAPWLAFTRVIRSTAIVGCVFSLFFLSSVCTLYSVERAHAGTVNAHGESQEQREQTSEQITSGRKLSRVFLFILCHPLSFCHSRVVLFQRLWTCVHIFIFRIRDELQMCDCSEWRRGVVPSIKQETSAEKLKLAIRALWWTYANAGYRVSYRVHVFCPIEIAAPLNRLLRLLLYRPPEHNLRSHSSRSPSSMWFDASPLWMRQRGESTSFVLDISLEINQTLCIHRNRMKQFTVLLCTYVSWLIHSTSQTINTLPNFLYTPIRCSDDFFGVASKRNEIDTEGYGGIARLLLTTIIQFDWFLCSRRSKKMASAEAVLLWGRVRWRAFAAIGTRSKRRTSNDGNFSKRKKYRVYCWLRLIRGKSFNATTLYSIGKRTSAILSDILQHRHQAQSSAHNLGQVRSIKMECRKWYGQSILLERAKWSGFLRIVKLCFDIRSDSWQLHPRNCTVSQSDSIKSNKNSVKTRVCAHWTCCIA